MELFEIGASGLRTPFLALGTWAIGGGDLWGDNDDALSVRTIEEALERGVVWVDTAPAYGFGHSESVVGRALKGKRERFLLSTKCGLEWDHETPFLHKKRDGETIWRDLSPTGIRRDLENSLRRLGTDYVDIYYTHWQSPDFSVYPLEETVGVLMELKKEGKIRAIGASNVTPEIVESYCRLGQLDVIQEKYSILDRKKCEELRPVCEANRVTIQAYSPLEQGLLTGRATMETVLAEKDVRNNNRFWKPENRSRALKMMETFREVSGELGCSVSSLVIAYTASTIPGLNVLGGARKPEQIRDNAQALTLTLEKSLLARLDAACPRDM